MEKQLRHFEPLRPAETKFTREMNNGAVVRIGDEAPENPSDAITIRASFLRYLALGGCDKLKTPNRGIRIRGAYIESDGSPNADTPGIDLEGCSISIDIFLF